VIPNMFKNLRMVSGINLGAFKLTH
jgi:hypothetical protein